MRLHHAVGLHGGEGEVHDPEEHEEEGGGDLQTARAAQLATVPTSEEEHANRQEGLHAENDDREGKGAFFDLNYNRVLIDC